MQRFVEADYYELDWYYEECTDGKKEKSSPLPLRGREGWGESPMRIKHFQKSWLVTWSAMDETVKEYGNPIRAETYCKNGG